MRLVSLIVRKSTTNEIIRNIKFNPTGLSLIVDETNKSTSGSNIGKTTAVKIIDLCLGANAVASLYKEKDTGENVIVGDFLEKNKVTAELTCKVGENFHVFKRPLYRNGKTEIDGEIKSSLTEYKQELNEIIFDNIINKPTLRQLIGKFIRLENSNESSLLKYLGNHTKNYEYQAIYEYLFGIDTAKSENVNILTQNESIEKDIEAIYRKNGVSSLKEFETKISLMREEVEKHKEIYSEVTVVDDYSKKVQDMKELLADIQKLESYDSKLTLKKELMNEKIKKEESKIFTVDTKLLKKLYDETKLSLDAHIRSFEELETFHNGMVNKRISMLHNSYDEIKKESDLLEVELQKLRRIYESNYVSFNVELKDKFEEKYKEYATNKVKLENYLNDYSYIVQKQLDIEVNLSKKVTEVNDISKKDNIEERLNHYFKELTSEIIDETFAIVLNENKDDEFPVKIIGMNGKPGTGIKKAMITCFDLAHIDLIIEKEYHMPVFAIHDKLENIDLKELQCIVSEAREFKGQYIFPILNDRISTLGILEEEVVLRLSSEDKFFRI